MRNLLQEKKILSSSGKLTSASQEPNSFSPIQNSSWVLIVQLSTFKFCLLYACEYQKKKLQSSFLACFLRGTWLEASPGINKWRNLRTEKIIQVQSGSSTWALIPWGPVWVPVLDGSVEVDFRISSLCPFVICLSLKGSKCTEYITWLQGGLSKMSQKNESEILPMWSVQVC